MKACSAMPSEGKQWRRDRPAVRLAQEGTRGNAPSFRPSISNFDKTHGGGLGAESLTGPLWQAAD